MALNFCPHCTTLFAVGMDACPHCGGKDFTEEGTMAKITVHGGASNAAAGEGPTPKEASDTEAVVVEDEAPSDTEGVEETAEVEEVGPYDSWTLAELQEECANRGLVKSGNKPDLVQRLLDDDERTPEPADEADEEVQPAF